MTRKCMYVGMAGNFFPYSWSLNFLVYLLSWVMTLCLRGASDHLWSANKCLIRDSGVIEVQKINGKEGSCLCFKMLDTRNKSYDCISVPINQIKWCCVLVTNVCAQTRNQYGLSSLRLQRTCTTCTVDAHLHLSHWDWILMCGWKFYIYVHVWHPRAHINR